MVKPTISSFVVADILGVSHEEVMLAVSFLSKTTDITPIKMFNQMAGGLFYELTSLQSTLVVNHVNRNRAGELQRVLRDLHNTADESGITTEQDKDAKLQGRIKKLSDRVASMITNSRVCKMLVGSYTTRMDNELPKRVLVRNGEFRLTETILDQISEYLSKPSLKIEQNGRLVKAYHKDVFAMFNSRVNRTKHGNATI